MKANFIFACFALAAALPANTVVPTKYGAVSGRVVDGVRQWLGVPFAAPPVGSLRWTPPAPPTPWSSPLDTTAYKPSCAQSVNFSPPLGETSEDCLYLNVFAPTAPAPPGGFPVALWAHGGGYANGGPNEARLNGTFNVGRFQDVIIVVPAYRLNVFGFLGSDAMRGSPQATTGNWGMLDQRAALQWVKDNIAGFGGNPGSVLLYGESAGAGSVSNHLAMPGSWGLFHRAAMESGAFSDWVSRNMSTANNLYAELLTTTGCQTLACLRALPTQTLLNTTVGSGNLTAGYGKTLAVTWTPTEDGVELMASPRHLAAQGKVAPVPIIAGSVRDEGAAFLGTVPHNLDATAFGAVVASFYGESNVAAISKLYPASAYPNSSAVSSYFWALERAVGDYLMTCPARRTVRWFEAVGQPAYLFMFSRSPANGTFVYHSQDIPYVFNAAPLLPTPDDVIVGNLTSTYWMNFARSANPNSPTAVGQPWPVVSSAASPTPALNIDVYPAVVDGLRTAACDFWDKYEAEE